VRAAVLQFVDPRVIEIAVQVPLVIIRRYLRTLAPDDASDRT
jgi:hypothetical protein